jgi:hypothetical protein
MLDLALGCGTMAAQNLWWAIWMGALFSGLKEVRSGRAQQLHSMSDVKLHSKTKMLLGLTRLLEGLQWTMSIDAWRAVCLPVSKQMTARCLDAELEEPVSI